MSLTVKQLLNKQPPYIVNHAASVRLTKVKRAETKKHGLPAILATAYDPQGSERGHACQVVAVKSKRHEPTIKAGLVKVSCDCEFFTYYCEYALTKWGAANIRYSNGEPASSTNPQNFPLLCKHLYKLLERVNRLA